MLGYYFIFYLCANLQLIQSEITNVQFSLFSTQQLLVDAKVSGNGTLKFKYYRKDNSGDTLKKIQQVQDQDVVTLARLNPYTDYIFKAYEVLSNGLNKRVAEQEITTQSCGNATYDNILIQNITGTTSYDVLVFDQGSGLLATDKYGIPVWYCGKWGYAKQQLDDYTILTMNNLLGVQIFNPYAVITEISFIKGDIKCNILEEVVPNAYTDWRTLETDPIDSNLVYSQNHGVVGAELKDDTLVVSNFSDGSTKLLIDYTQFFSQDEWVDLGWAAQNSLDFGTNNNFIVSMRNINTIAAFSYEDQKLQWVLSAYDELSNFTFEDQNAKFYTQHDVTQLENGNILLFDNGALRPEEEGGKYSRACEYELDFESMTVKLVWQFNVNGFFNNAGSVKKLENGNVIVHCDLCNYYNVSSAEELLDFTYEVDPNGNMLAFIQTQVFYTLKESNPVWGVSYMGSYRSEPWKSLNGEYISDISTNLNNKKAVLEEVNTVQSDKAIQ